MVLIAYFATARIGLRFGAVAGFATLVWPPTGIAVAAMLLSRSRLWPAVFAGAFLVNWSIGAPVPVALGIALGNTLEAAAATWLLAHDDKFRLSLEGPRSVLALIGFGAGLATLIGASVGTLSLWLGGRTDAAHAASVWQTWWLGDLFGALIFTPLLLAWLSRRVQPSGSRALRTLEASLLVAAFAAISYGILGLADPLSFNVTVVSFVLMVPLIWAGVRFGSRGATLALLAFSGLAVFATAIGRGPFAAQTLSQGLGALQVFIGMTAVIALFLGSAHDERLRAEAGQERLTKSLRSQTAYVRSVVEIAPVGIELLDRESHLLRINPAGMAMIESASEEQALGTPMLGRVVEADQPIFRDLLARVFEGGSGEMRHGLNGLKGADRTIDMRLVPYRDTDGMIVAALGTFLDVSKEVGQASALEARNRELERLNTLMVGRELTMADMKKDLKERRRGPTAHRA